MFDIHEHHSISCINLKLNISYTNDLDIFIPNFTNWSSHWDMTWICPYSEWHDGTLLNPYDAIKVMA